MNDINVQLNGNQAPNNSFPFLPA